MSWSLQQFNHNAIKKQFKLGASKEGPKKISVFILLKYNHVKNLGSQLLLCLWVSAPQPPVAFVMHRVSSSWPLAQTSNLRCQTAAAHWATALNALLDNQSPGQWCQHRPDRVQEVFAMLSGTWCSWGCPVQSQELDFHDPCEFLTTQDLL